MRVENVNSGKKPPKAYRGRWIHNWYWDLEPSVIGQDPMTNKDVCWGDGVHICCQLEDNPYSNSQDIPF